MTAHMQSNQQETTEKLERLVAQCYPVIQDQIAEMALKIKRNRERKTGLKTSPEAAREIVLKLILLTGGDILEI